MVTGAVTCKTPGPTPGRIMPPLPTVTGPGPESVPAPRMLPEFYTLKEVCRFSDIRAPAAIVTGPLATTALGSPLSWGLTVRVPDCTSIGPVLVVVTIV